MSDDLINAVYIKRLEEYDREALHDIIIEGMRELEFEPRGKVYLKPNVVVAHKPEVLGNKACTPRELIGAAMLALSEQDGVSRVDLGENASIGFPTRMCYHYAGYYDELAQVRPRAKKPVDLFCIDEEKRREEQRRRDDARQRGGGQGRGSGRGSGGGGRRGR